MKTIRARTFNLRLAAYLLPVIFSLCLSLGCTSEEVKAFRKANGRTVVVDKTFEIQKEYVEATVLRAGIYQLEFKEGESNFLWFKSSLSDSYTVLLNYPEYKKVADHNVFRDATPADFEVAERVKDEKKKIIEAKSVDVRSLIFVAGEEYPGDTIMKAIDRVDSKANFRSDQTIIFSLDDRYYYMGTTKVNYDNPAIYKITFIKYKGLPWTRDDF